MNFDLTEDEEMFKALAERFVSDHYDLDRRRSYIAQECGFSSSNWALLGELGLIAAPFDESVGGMSMDATGIATVFEALGRGLAVEPLIENVLIGGRLFAATAPDTLREAWLPQILTGERRIALAHAETRLVPGHCWIETTAQSSGETTTLFGSKTYVPAGGCTDGYIVSARESGDPSDQSGIALFFVPANIDGITARTWRMADGGTAVSLVLEDVRIGSENRLSGGLADIEEINVMADLARSAEALGIMERIFSETLEYLRTREQFGVKLASMQALQHRMAAQYAVIEQSRAMLNLAMVKYGTSEFQNAVAGTRAFIGPASVQLGHEMIQFNGGMGVTDELAIGHGHKRMLVLSRWPDGPDAALDRYAGIA